MPYNTWVYYILHEWQLNPNYNCWDPSYIRGFPSLSTAIAAGIVAIVAGVAAARALPGRAAAAVDPVAVAAGVAEAAAEAAKKPLVALAQGAEGAVAVHVGGTAAKSIAAAPSKIRSIQQLSNYLNLLRYLFGELW